MYSLIDTDKPQPVLTVSELTAQIQLLVEAAFDHITVSGEVSNAKVYPSGHWYFSLKDKEATLPCVCFKKANSQIKFNLEDGLTVVARGKLSVYPPRGAYQMVINYLAPVGIGDWQLAFEQLRHKFEEEGLLSPERKRPIPQLPRKVGVVTSLAGAALRDILSALKRRNRTVSVLIRPVKVQGEGSAEEIAEGIQDLQSAGVDVILIARGGGSIEDLWSFNTEIVGRAVANSAIPTISGVGHETDFTICDLVADLRAPTPTAAAELVASGEAELTQRWVSLRGRLISSVDHRIVRAQRLLERLNPLHSLLRYRERLQRFKLKCSHQAERMIRILSSLLSQANQRWQGNHERLLALSPLSILSRGFAILLDSEGQAIRQADEVSAGDELTAVLHSGKLTVRVESSLNQSWYQDYSGGQEDERE